MVKVQLKGHNIIPLSSVSSDGDHIAGKAHRGSADPGQASRPAKVPFILGGNNMAQIGLADTLKLLAAGYKKKDIEALASIDETPIEQGQDTNTTPTTQPSNDPAPAPEDKEEPDYKKLYDETVNKLDNLQKKLDKLQQDNTHKDSAPAAAEAKQKEAETLTNLVRGFM